MEFMVKKIGKISLFFICMVSSFHLFGQPSVTVIVFDKKGMPVDTVGLGAPFFIDVVTTTEDHTSLPKLVTDPSIETTFQGSSSRVYSINGTRSATKSYRYSACAYKEGTFDVGPATIMIASQEQTSEVQKLTVAAGVAIQDVAKDSKAYVKITVDKEKVFPGEAVIFTLRVYMTDDSVHIEGIQEPIFKDCTATPLEGPIMGHEEIDGVMYNYLEWKNSFYARNPGTLVIPAVVTQVSIESKRTGDMDNAIDFFGMMSGLLGTRVERSQLVSNALKIEVASFPEFEGKDNGTKPIAFGNFSSLVAKTNVDCVAKSDAVVYTLELVGQGNFDMIPHPKLDLPHGLYYYESKSTVHSLGAGIFKKDFEYIIQGMHPDKYKIPSQQLIFLDAKKHTYKTLHTKSVLLEITDSKVVKDVAAYTLDVETIKEGTRSNDMSAAGIDLGGLEENNWQDIPMHALSYTTFFWLIMLCLFGYFVCFIYYFSRYYFKKTAPSRIRKAAFKSAYQQVALLQKENNFAGLYGEWITLFAVRLRVDQSLITQDYIESVLRSLKFSQALVHEWNSFFTRVMAAYYSVDRQDHANQRLESNLFDQTRIWLRRLEDKI